ncbi:MAG TPA: hypothetical protein DIT13_07845 [Verrucomicrobiales bacterium]|nr:hypothetical protein [Verrucomicrobiales bacterium]HRJ11098.1 hypothetical protein [Prosthecobacter sp.]HRK16876.1 hypothetical protein [Prosthecobacter sp.]
MLGLIVNTVALMAILWMLARHEADLSFGRTMLVVFGITFGCGLLGLLHPLAPLAAFAVVTPLALKFFFYLRTGPAFGATGLFLVWLVVWELLWAWLRRP